MTDSTALDDRSRFDVLFHLWLFPSASPMSMSLQPPGTPYLSMMTSIVYFSMAYVATRLRCAIIVAPPVRINFCLLNKPFSKDSTSSTKRTRTNIRISWTSDRWGDQKCLNECDWIAVRRLLNVTRSKRLHCDIGARTNARFIALRLHWQTRRSWCCKHNDQRSFSSSSSQLRVSKSPADLVDGRWRTAFAGSN